VIARITPGGKGFKGPISYMETGKGGRARKEDRVAWTEFWNLPTRNSKAAACMMRATANASVSNTQDPVYLFSVSLDPDDPADEPMLRRIAARTIRDMGLQEYEAVVYCHKDRSHPHLHFVVNRVHPERRTLWSPWRDYYRIEKSLRAQEKEFGLRVVPPPPRDVGRSGPGQEGRAPRLHRGDAAFVAAVTERATTVLEQASSWAELMRGLAEHGLSIRVKGGGIVLTDARQEVKASQVGRQFSRGNLEERFGSYPDYRARMAVANAISPTGRAVLPTREEPHAPPVETIPSPTPELTGSAPEPPAPAPAPLPRARSGRRPQFGDAGHGISELFGQGQTQSCVAHAPAPQPELQVGGMAPVAEPDVHQRQAPILRAEPVAPRVPSSTAADPAPLDPLHITPERPRQQFGDAGHGIAELFGYGEAPAPERPAPAPELATPAPEPAEPAPELAGPAPEPAGPAVERASVRPQQPERRDTAFLLDVRKRATPVLRRAKSWAELERGLSDHGLSLRVKGGGFTITDGDREVKASDVARAFSRFHLEKEERLGHYPDAHAPITESQASRVPATPPADIAPSSPAPAREQELVPVQPELVFTTPASSTPEPPPLETGTPTPAILPQVPVQPIRETVAPPLPVYRRPSEPVKPPAPRRTRTAPPTERDKYREVVWSFRQKLAGYFHHNARVVSGPCVALVLWCLLNRYRVERCEDGACYIRDAWTGTVEFRLTPLIDPIGKQRTTSPRSLDRLYDTVIADCWGALLPVHGLQILGNELWSGRPGHPCARPATHTTSPPQLPITARDHNRVS
jgi:Relaxase/Mobilisation nuclease domain